jgi:hypothetical protein
LFRHIQTGYINFLLAACLGLILRLFFSGWKIPIPYQHLLHAHSHTAVLGWCSQTVLAILCFYYLPEKSKLTNRLYITAQVAILGMLVGFIIQGYALFSILFSSIHLIISYIFAINLWKNKVSEGIEKSTMRWALGFLFFSSTGVWLLPISIVIFGKGSTEYQLSIQFYLHFMFNGWLFLGPLTLLLIQFRNQLKTNISKLTEKLLLLYVLSILLSFAFNISWFYNHKILYLLNSIAVVSQLFILLIIYQKRESFFITNSAKISLIFKIILLFIASFLSIKVLMQTLLLFPEIFESITHIRSLHIGFIHLLMLGLVSGSLIYITGSLYPRIAQKKLFFIGVILLIISICSTEGLIFFSGLGYWIEHSYHSQIQMGLIIFSSSLLLSIGILSYSFLQQKNKL